MKKKRKIFIVSATNTGGTVLQGFLESAENTAGLNNEGRNLLQDWMEGHDDRSIFPYDRGWGQNIRLFYQHADVLANPANYKWQAIREIYFSEWASDNEGADILIEKSPGNILRTEMIDRHFENVFFLFLIRDPYAQIEGIQRRSICDIDEAIDQSIRFGRDVVRKAEGRRCFLLRYRDMTEGRGIDKLLDWSGVKGPDAEQNFKVHNVKGDKPDGFRNFNEDNKGHLHDDEKRKITRHLRSRHDGFMSRFDYEYMKSNKEAMSHG